LKFIDFCMTFYYLLAQKFLLTLFRSFYGLKPQGVRGKNWDGGLIIASNHQSFIDPIVIGSAAPRELYYFAKEEIFSWPVIGFLARSFNAFPVKREAFDLEAIRAANRVLRSGKALVVFIEGTRSRTGELLPPKNGVGLLAYQNRVDVLPAYVHGTFRLRRSLLHYPGLIVAFGERMRIADYEYLGLPKKDLYNRIAQDAMAQIRRLKADVLRRFHTFGYSASQEAKNRKGGNIEHGTRGEKSNRSGSGGETGVEPARR